MGDRKQDAAAVRLIGGAMLTLGLVFCAPSALLLLDGVASTRVLACATAIGVPLVVAGARRLAAPERY